MSNGFVQKIIASKERTANRYTCNNLIHVVICMNDTAVMYTYHFLCSSEYAERLTCVQSCFFVLDMVSILINFSIPGEILFLLPTLGVDYCSSDYLLVTN